jgi:phosphoglycerate dehydrogenase-like enzyme
VSIKTTVSYSDPSWAVDDNGSINVRAADLEKNIYGAGCELRLGLLESGRYVTEGADLGKHLAGSDAIVVYRAKVTAELLAQIGPGCRVFARQGVGVDTFDLDAIREYGAFAFNVPDYCVDETSTHTLALMLALERDICQQDRLIKDGEWSIRAGRVPVRLSDATLGIVGFGQIGRAVARKALPFFGKIIAFDPFVHGDLMAGYGAEAALELETLLSYADVVSLHASLTPDSDELISKEILGVVKPGMLLVNTARGRLINSADILSALNDGRLGGYATDVYYPERPDDNEVTRSLARHPRVISSCHRGFLSTTADVSVRIRVAEQVREVLRTGGPPSYGRLA